MFESSIMAKRQIGGNMEAKKRGRPRKNNGALAPSLRWQIGVTFNDEAEKKRVLEFFETMKKEQGVSISFYMRRLILDSMKRGA